MEELYHVYIMTNKSNHVLYTGVTSDLQNRVLEHKDKVHKGFTAKYNVNKLVYFEAFDDITKASLVKNRSKPAHVKRKST